MNHEPGYSLKPRRTAPEVGAFNVRDKACSNCLFTKNRIVSKQRADQIVEDCLTDGKHFTCHEFHNVCCRNFFDIHKDDIPIIKFATQINRINWVDSKQP